MTPTRPAESLTLAAGIGTLVAHFTGAPIGTTTAYVAVGLSAVPAAVTWLVANGGLWQRVHGLRGLLRAIWTGVPSPPPLFVIDPTTQPITVTPPPPIITPLHENETAWHPGEPTPPPATTGGRVAASSSASSPDGRVTVTPSQ